MFADVEVISNNTYGYNQFTYSIPHKFKTKLSIGSFVKVEFRNKIVDALVVNLKSKTEIKNSKNILKVLNRTLNNEQNLYCKYIALSNRLNCGILLISHDLHTVMSATDHVVCLNGHVCCSGSPSDVAKNNEYKALFGEQASQILTRYEHRHDHIHTSEGEIKKN